MLLSQKRKTFSKNLIAFSESIQNIAHFKKKAQHHMLNNS